MVTQERLKEVLDYDPKSGIFIWKKFNVKGKRAGSVSDGGYLKLRIDRKAYRVHRLAWLYVYGHWPEKDIDHVDRNPANNALSNLREVTNAHSAQNRIAPNGNTPSKLRGVTWHKHTKKWQARITLNYKQTFLGYFDTVEEAHAAYLAAKQSLHPHVQLPKRG